MRGWVDNEYMDMTKGTAMREDLEVLWASEFRYLLPTKDRYSLCPVEWAYVGAVWEVLDYGYAI